MKAFTAIITIFMALMVFDRKDTIPMDLTQFQWKNRLLLVFVTNENDPLFKKLRNEIIAHKAEVKNRDLVIFEVLEKGLSRMNTTYLDQEAVDSIRNRFAVPQSKFRVILIGKDGGVKLKLDDQVDLKKIFDLIDSMPMRKYEMLMEK